MVQIGRSNCLLTWFILKMSTLTIDAAAKAAAASPAKSEPGFDSSIFHDGLATVYSSALPQVP